MSSGAIIRPPADEAEQARTADILCAAFGATMEDARRWMDLVGIENSRILIDGGQIAGCLKIIPMGQWFGGRRMSMAGIAGVAVAPECRSRAVGSRLMQAAVQEMHERGIRLSVLYPATQPIYRRVGYEQAGAHYDIQLSLKSIDVRDRSLEIAPITPDDVPAVENCYRERASRSNGHTDRGPYIWQRVREPRGEGKARGFVVRGANGIEGYIYYTQKHAHSDSTLHASDVVTLTPAAGRRLLAFLADHRSIAQSITWHGSLGDPLLALLAELRFGLKHTLHEYWMLRVLDLRGALEERGYRSGLTAEVHLEVHDPLIAANSGRFVLHVADGRGRVETGGRGDVRMDIRGLAALFTGHQSAFELAASERASGAPGDLDAATAIFADGPPWMPDRF